MADLDWLNGPLQPRIFGDYDSVRRDYLVGEFIADVEKHGIIASVYIQVNWPYGKELDEAAWVQTIADKFGWPNAIIGFVDFASESCAKTLENLAQLPLMRGIRQQLHWHKNPQYRFSTDPDIMLNSNWRNNFAILQNYDWCFELQVFYSQMKKAAKLAAEFSNTTIILQHCGMPEDSSKAGLAAWLEGMKHLAEQPNIYCKFSGLGTFIHTNSSEFISEITGHCLELFGASRCIYGSNFPIEKIWTSYSDLINSYKRGLSDLSEEAQNRIFYLNAKNVYKIEV